MFFQSRLNTALTKQRFSVLASTILFALTVLFSGCSTSSRTVDKPIEGSYRTTFYSYKKQKNGYYLAFRSTSETHAYFGFIQNYKTPVKKSNEIKRHYMSGADRDCPTMVIATFGILLPIDFIIWAVQLGSNDSMCFAQLYDNNPSTTWSKEFTTGQYYEFSEPYTGTMKFSYKGRTIPAENAAGGVWSIRLADLPKDVNIHKTVLKNNKLLFQ